MGSMTSLLTDAQFIINIFVAKNTLLTFVIKMNKVIDNFMLIYDTQAKCSIFSHLYYLLSNLCNPLTSKTSCILNHKHPHASKPHASSSIINTSWDQYKGTKFSAGHEWQLKYKTIVIKY